MCWVCHVTRPRILILDEATSALDTLNEQVWSALEVSSRFKATRMPSLDENFHRSPSHDFGILHGLSRRGKMEKNQSLSSAAHAQ